MKKIIFILFTIHYSLFTLLNAASVEAVLSQNEVVQGNPVQLKITAEGDRAQFPQIEVIDGVPVEGRSQTQHTSLQIINGKSTVTHTTNLILTFTPKKEMHIPSYSVTIDGKRYRTDPLTLKVVKSTAPKSLNSGKFSLVMKADKKEVVVGEPIVVTVYFSVRNDVRLADNPQYNRPSFKDFFVKEVNDEKSYTKGDHRITELRYVLIPQKEGHFTIEPATAKIAVADMSRRDIFGRYFATTWTPIASNTLEIDVKPEPKDTDLVGRFYIESKIDKTTTKENKPVNLTVTIEGDGSLEDYEMPNYDIDGVTVYSDDAEVTTKVIGDKIKSRYVKKFAFIADHDFEIPARTLSAYDPQTKEVKTLKIPGYSITVESNRHATPAAGTSSKKEVHSGEVQTDIKLSQTPQQQSKPVKTVERESVAWWMVVLAFLGGMVTMYLLGKFKWKKRTVPFKETEALKILYGHMSDDPEVEAMVRKLYAKKNGDKSVIIDKKELRALVEKYMER
jgi:hypothetical protein